MRGREFSFDVVERERRGIDNARAGRTVAEQRTRHDRAGIEAEPGSVRSDLRPLHRDEIGRAPGRRADEVHRHGAASPDRASAHVAAPKTRRADRSTAPRGRQRQSAAASAADGTPANAMTRSERVRVRAPATPATRRCRALRRLPRPNFAAAASSPGFAVLERDRRDAIECIRCETGAREGGADRRLYIRRRCTASAAEAGDNHGLFQTRLRQLGIRGAPARRRADRPGA